MSALDEARSQATVSGDDLASVLAYLELTVNRRLRGLLRGSFASHASGDGSDPDSAREYVIGDDVRRMDWAVTARTGRAHVRTQEAERELECWIVAEPAARLATGAETTTKRHLLLAATSAISVLNDAPGSRTGLLAGETMVTPGLGRNHNMMMLHRLAHTTTEHNVSVDIDTVLTRAPRAGLLVLSSDFLGPVDWSDALRVAAAHCQIMAIRLVDPADEHLPGTGPVVLADPATGATVELNITKAARDEYAARAAAHHEQVMALLRQAQAQVITLRTDSDWVLDFARQLGRL